MPVLASKKSKQHNYIDSSYLLVMSDSEHRRRASQKIILFSAAIYKNHNYKNQDTNTLL